MPQVTFTCVDSVTTLPVPGVNILVMTSRGGITVMGVTGADGTFIATIESGAFIVTAQKKGVACPREMVIQVTEQATSILVTCKVLTTIPVPVVQTCRVFGVICSQEGRFVSTQVRVEFFGKDIHAGIPASRIPDTATADRVSHLVSDKEGFWEFDAVIGAKVRVWIPATGFDRLFFVPNRESANVVDIAATESPDLSWT